ncbi:MAG: flagellar biosynthetic protein FliO [Alteromonadaceae bacterium]|nr:flagellar biosynthetic protein FliO [Alteromonadaceae bacterium]
MDAMTMILSLLMVLVLIVVVAVVLKRFQPKRQGLAGLKIITSVHLGSKERLVVVQVADKQLLLGVTAQQITLLDNLEKPLDTGVNLTSELGQSVISFFQKQTTNKMTNIKVKK